MTRMWGVNPRFLCKKHLLGEHSEMHQEVGTIKNHPHGKAVVKGHAKKKQVDTSMIKERHDKLVEEMDRRGMNHDSPMDYQDELKLGSIEVRENIKDLKERCESCRERIKELS